MAKDLNFDELDQAVTSFMQKSRDQTPGRSIAPASRPSPGPSLAPSSARVPVVGHAAEPASAPAAAAPVSTPAPKVPDSAPSTPEALSSSSQARVQFRNRSGMVARKTPGLKFHDIMPAHRRSTVVPGKRIEPVNDTASFAEAPITEPPKPSLPEAPVPPAIPPLPEENNSSSMPNIQPATPPNETPQASEPKILTEQAPITASNALVPETEAPEIAPQKPDMEPAAAASNEPEVAPMPASAPVVSDALLADLRKESEAASAEQAASADTPAPERPALGVLDSTPLELEDRKAAEEQPAAPASTGLMDTGELRQSGTPVDTSHMLDAGSDDDQSMKVFDTKEYHTPITAGHTAPPKKSKKWQIIIIVLIILIIAAGAFIAYMMTSSGAI